MRIPRIYTPMPIAVGETVTLADDTTHYLTRVLRLKAGAQLVIFNGEGGEYKGTLKTLQRRCARVLVEHYNDVDRESPLVLTLAQGISRGERMTYTLQKAVELGVREIQPLFTEHCDVRLNNDRAEKRRQHWQGIANSACEQCGRNRVPVIKSAQIALTWLEAQLATKDAGHFKLVLDHRANFTLARLEGNPTSVTLLAGPEGGLSDHELDQAIQAGFTDVRLGPRVLRSETAAVAALAAVNVKWGDFN